MNRELAFRVVYAVVYLSAISIRAYYSWRASPVVEKNFLRRWKRVADTEGKLSAVLWSVLPFFLILFAFLYVILHHELILLFVLPLPTWFRWMGVCLGISAIPFLIWVHQTIGKYWVAYLDFREEHILVTDGPYRWIRHPMYTQSIALLISIALISTNLLMVLCSILTIILILHRVRKEERMMMERFGDEYRNYMKHTGRLLPRFINRT